MSATLPSDPTVPQEGRKTSRKQWSVQGGPRGLLRRMRSQLAEDGCPESQLVMGRTLLQQLGDSETDEEDARLAVFWLNQASLQGNKEATDLLQDCLNRNVGICEHNYREIRECLAMDLQEKLARRAAHLLFCSLSDGNDFVNSGSLNLKIQNLIDGKEEEKSIEDVQFTNSSVDGSTMQDPSRNQAGCLKSFLSGLDYSRLWHGRETCQNTTELVGSSERVNIRSGMIWNLASLRVEMVDGHGSCRRHLRWEKISDIWDQWQVEFPYRIGILLVVRLYS